MSIESVTIEVPEYIIRTRGLAAVGRQYSRDLKIRFNDNQIRQLNIAARICGVHRASFIRWCACKAAEAIIEQHNSQ